MTTITDWQESSGYGAYSFTKEDRFGFLGDCLDAFDADEINEIKTWIEENVACKFFFQYTPGSKVANVNLMTGETLTCGESQPAKIRVAFTDENIALMFKLRFL